MVAQRPDLILRLFGGETARPGGWISFMAGQPLGLPKKDGLRLKSLGFPGWMTSHEFMKLEKTTL